MIQKLNASRFQSGLNLVERLRVAAYGTFERFHAPNSSDSDSGSVGKLLLLPTGKGSCGSQLAVIGQGHGFIVVHMFMIIVLNLLILATNFCYSPYGGTCMAKEQEVKLITIPQIQLGRMTVRIGSVTPLIVNKFREDSREQIEKKQQKKARVEKEARDPFKEFQGSLHVIEMGQPDEKAKKIVGGKYGFPSEGLKKSLVVAGGRFADETMTVLRGVLNIPLDLIPIEGSDPEMRSGDFVVLNGGKTSIAYRPMFREWRMTVPVMFMKGMIKEEQILNLFQMAGFAVGIGAWRPEKNGTFGQFEILGGEA